MKLIADAGNSKTDWALTGCEIKSTYIQTAGVSPYFDGKEKLVSIFMEAYNRLGSPEPEEIVFFGTGCLFEKQKSKIREALKHVFDKTLSVSVFDDLTGAAIALFSENNGIAVILGTGSNAGVYKNHRVSVRSASLGYLLGDEGSGADIGFRFLRVLLSGRLPEELRDSYFAYSGNDIAGILSLLYSGSKPQAYAASCLPFIKKYIHIPPLSAIVDDAFNSMIDNILSPLIKANPELMVGFCGGVADLFRTELTDLMKQRKIITERIIGQPMPFLVEYFNLRPAV